MDTPGAGCGLRTAFGNAGPIAPACRWQVRVAGDCMPAGVARY